MSNNCRTCGHFYRVFPEEGGRLRYVSCQGFCILGTLTADFSLYVGTSKSHECPAYFLSEYNAETQRLERELDRKLDDWRGALLDHRTREYKILVEKSCQSMQDYLKSVKPAVAFFSLGMRPDLNEEFIRIFCELHTDELNVLRERKRMRAYRYWEIMKDITTKFKSLHESELMTEYQKEEEEHADNDLGVGDGEGQDTDKHPQEDQGP